MAFESQPLVRVDARPEHGLDLGSWPATVPAVGQLLADGLAFSPGITFLVGENGSGKSTLIEAIAMAYGLSPEGGTNQGTHSTRPSESPLARALWVQRGLGTRGHGFFLRAETMHGWFTYLEGLPPGGTHASYHAMSHGESFNAVLDWAINPDFPGLLVLDEPEAALSFNSTLRLIAALAYAREIGCQVVCATHSPVLASAPGADIIELGDWGYRTAAWAELELVAHWRAYLEAPGRYLRHLLD